MRQSIFIILLLFPFLHGCDSFLSQVPDDRTEINDLESVKSLLVSAYPNGQYMVQNEIMSDNTDDKGYWALSLYPEMIEEAYNWEDVTAEQQDSPSYYWTACYGSIAGANHALEAIEALGNPKEMDPYYGEALVIRAYSHFMLVNLWGKHFNPATIETDLGITYVDKPETEALALYKRNTVKEVYKRIDEDLFKALPMIRDNAYEVGKYHFTKAATNAFAARYFLFRGDNWEKVEEHCTAILGEGTGYKEQLRNYTEKYIPTSSNTTEYRKLFTNYNEPAVLLLIGSPSVWYRIAGFSRYGMSDKKRNELFPGRDPVSGGNTIYPIYGSSPHYHLNKVAEYFNYSYPGATTGIPYVFCTAFSMEEVVFNRAEAYVMLKEYDKALADINTFLSMRLTNYNPTAHTVTLEKIKREYDSRKSKLKPWYLDQIDSDQMVILQYIADLRQKEFYSEGLRWFDIRRFHIEIEHQIFGSGEKMILTEDDYRRELQIPATAISYGMEPNPR